MLYFTAEPCKEVATTSFPISDRWVVFASNKFRVSSAIKDSIDNTKLWDLLRE